MTGAVFGAGVPLEGSELFARSDVFHPSEEHHSLRSCFNCSVPVPVDYLVLPEGSVGCWQPKLLPSKEQAQISPGRRTFRQRGLAAQPPEKTWTTFDEGPDLGLRGVSDQAVDIRKPPEGFPVHCHFPAFSSRLPFVPWSNS